jgi:hypothetical protein
MHARAIIFAGIMGSLVAALCSGCATPNISSLDPDTGPERTLVNVHGDTFLSSLYWDAGSASEQHLSGGFLGSYLFTVPAAAPLGAHQTQLQRFGRRGNQRPFTVTAGLRYPAPRLDRISIVYATFPGGGQVNAWLYVQGANVDANAEVLINGAVVPTVAHKGIQNDLFGVRPQDLAYPVYHYLALLAAPGVQATGSTLNVRIRNADGQESGTAQYRLPDNAASLDSDGDDIPDTWEVNGYDANGDGVIDINLAALGAHPLRPDLFLEVDIMQGLANSPGNAVWNALTGAFANAPIINPVANNGVNLHLDTSGTVSFWSTIDFGGTETATHRRFNTLKTANFNDAVRGRIYHYCIWANMRPNGSSGISDVDWVNGGDDCIVSFDDFSASFQTAQSMAETIMHEFGHNLNQRHGGATHATNNPTYSSVMSYSWQLRTGRTNAYRQQNPVYAPFFYQLNAAVEAAGALPAGWVGVTVDYSEGMGRSLVENNLNEPAGLYNNNAVDWNSDGDQADAAASRDINGDGDTSDTLDDFSNWGGLVYRGPRNNGTN